MNRRDLLKASGIAAVTMMMAFPKHARAQNVVPPKEEVPNPVLQLTGAIDHNHGHAFAALDLTQVVLLLQQVHRDGTPATISIQGGSRHPHSVTLSQEILIQILAEGTVQVDSSTDANHSHPVALTLAPIA